MTKTASHHKRNDTPSVLASRATPMPSDEETEPNRSTRSIMLRSKASIISPLPRRRSDQGMRASKKQSSGKKTASSSLERQSPISPLPRRRSDQGMRTSKKDGLGKKLPWVSFEASLISPVPRSRSNDAFGKEEKSSAVARQSTTIYSDSPFLSPSPPSPPFSVRHMGLSPSMLRACQSKETSQATASLFSPTQSRRLPRRHIRKSTSLQIPRKTSHPNSSRKQVTQRSVSFSGRPSSVKIPSSPAMQTRKKINLDDSSFNGPKQARRLDSKQKRSSKSDANKGDDSLTDALSSKVMSITSNTPTAPDCSPRKVRFYDKVRFKSISHSRIEPNAIWYSKLDILSHRLREQDVKRQARSCHNSARLNVEGLFTEKEHCLMLQRRKESKEAIFDIQEANWKQREQEPKPDGSFGDEGIKYVEELNDDYDQHEAIAAEYARLSAPAVQSACRRASLLEMHVKLLSDLSSEYGGGDKFWPLFGEQEIFVDEAEMMIHRTQSLPLMGVLSRPMIRQAGIKSWLGSGTTLPPLKPPRSSSSSSSNLKKVKMVVGKSTNRKVWGQ